MTHTTFAKDKISKMIAAGVAGAMVCSALVAGPVAMADTQSGGSDTETSTPSTTPSEGGSGSGSESNGATGGNGSDSSTDKDTATGGDTDKDEAAAGNGTGNGSGTGTGSGSNAGTGSESTDKEDSSSASEAAKTVTIFRLYNASTGQHHYTYNSVEAVECVRNGWVNEGIGWIAPATGDPVYRLYNPNNGDHHYTMDENEKKELVKLGWNDEEIGWYSDTSKAAPLYRQFNPNETVGTHNYTTSKDENDALVKLGWRAEDIGWYGVDAGDTNAVEDFYKDYAKEILTSINTQRKAAGLTELAWDESTYRYTAGRANAISTKYSHDGMAPGFSEVIAKSEGALSAKNMASDIYTLWKNSTGDSATYLSATATKASVAIHVDKDGTAYAVATLS